MHRMVVRHVMDPLLQWRAGIKVDAVLEEMERRQWDTAGQLRELQWRKLRALLGHASANVPFYRSLFRELGARPEDFRSLEDIERLPVLTKAVVQARAADLRADRHDALFPRVTSGTTGIPLRTYIDGPTRDSVVAAPRRARRWWGLEVGDPYVRLVASLPTHRRRWRGVLRNEYTLKSADLSDGALLRLWRRIVRLKPAYLRGNPPVLSRLAQVVRERGGTEGLRLRAIVCSAETLYPHQRTLLAETFGAAVINHYGANEFGLISAECPAGRMHMTTDNVFVETRPVASGGGWTELVVTDLNNWGMPLIRYVLGDLGAPVDGLCPCGRGLPLLTLSAGRTGDFVVLPGRRYMYHGALVPIFNHIDGNRVQQYRIVQESLDRFTVLVAGAPAPDLVETIRRGFRRVLASRVAVDVRFVSQIPPEPSGKLGLFLTRIGSASVEKSAETVAGGADGHLRRSAEGEESGVVR